METEIKLHVRNLTQNGLLAASVWISAQLEQIRQTRNRPFLARANSELSLSRSGSELSLSRSAELSLFCAFETVPFLPLFCLPLPFLSLRPP